jgi:hypothetical protein
MPSQAAPHRAAFSLGKSNMQNRHSLAPALPPGPDSAILKLARALARQAAREDHERETRERENHQ